MTAFLTHVLGALGSTAGFAILLNAPRKTVLPASIIGMLGYALYYILLRELQAGLLFSYFLSTLFITVICEIEARRMRMPSTVFLLSALIPLVPGYDLYKMMLALVENDGASASASGISALLGVASIASAAAVSSAFFRSLVTSARKKREARLNRS